VTTAYQIPITSVFTAIIQMDDPEQLLERHLDINTI